MANDAHLTKLHEGVDAWNAWRREHPEVRPDLNKTHLRGADLFEVNLSGADLREADLSTANLSKADLTKANLFRVNLRVANLFEARISRADLRGADLSTADLFRADLTNANLAGGYLREADLSEANFSRADLRGAYLRRADLRGAGLFEANLSGADLRGADFIKADLRGSNLFNANLTQTTLVDTNVENATLTGCQVHGISVWNLKGVPKEQKNLLITRIDEDEAVITVDDLEVAQFIYMLRESKRIREVLTTITSKAVLLLGRFGERKYVLEALADVLRQKGYITIIFDFKEPDNRDLIDTVKTLALLSKFVIIDLTDPRSTPYELSQIASLMVPIQPLLQNSETEPAFLEPLRRRHHWLLQTHCYQGLDSLRESLENELLDVVEVKAAELKARE